MNETANVTAPPAGRLKMIRISWLVGAIVASAGLAALAANILMTSAVLNGGLATQIRRTTGFVTAIHGKADFALFPQPHLDIESISFSNPQAALHIDAERFVGYLRILPLLAGRIEVGRGVLYQPKMVIDLDDKPMTPDSAIGRAAAAKSASAEAAAIDRAKLGIIDIVDGSARLHHNGGKQDIFVDKINVTADWRSLDASATLTGQFDVRNVPMHLKAWVAQPVEILRGGDSAMTVQLESGVLGVQASGRVALVHLHYMGGLYITAPSLRGALELAGFTLAKHGRFGAFDLRCDADIDTSTASLTNLRLDLDNNEYEGTLAVQPDGDTPRLSGTLATNLLDVTPFLEGMPQPLAPNGGWSRARLELADLGFTNLDLRLSASRLRLHAMELKDAALSMLTRPGFIDLTLAEATANGGAVRGRLSLSSKGKALNLRLSGNATDVSLKPMLRRGATVKHPLSGALSGSLMLESTGVGFDALMRGLSGHAQVNVANGGITGVDLLAALQKARPADPIAPENPVRSVTSFDKAAFGLQITHGVATIVQGHAAGPAASGLTARFGGSADLGGRSLNLWALAEPAAVAGKTDVHAAPLRIRLTGPWDHLNLAVDRPPSPSSAAPP